MLGEKHGEEFSVLSAHEQVYLSGKRAFLCIEQTMKK
jgi:hypothetical protein